MSSTPTNNPCFFEFTSSGYTAPAFDDVNFDFSVNVPTMSEIKATIVGMELERDYLKSCEEYVVGFDQDNLQILRHSCVYGGIRDLQAYVLVLSNLRDLAMYIKQGYTGQTDILFGVRGGGSTNEDLPTVIKGAVQSDIDLVISLKRGYSDQVELFNYLKGFYTQQADLLNIVKGRSTGNIVDLLNAIKGSQTTITNIPAYLKTTVSQTDNLSAIVYKIWQPGTKDIDLILHSWQEVQLQKIVQALHITDLNMLLRSIYITNLGAALYAIQPVDITAGLFGWAIHDLNAYIVDGVYDGDLPFYLNTIPPVNLGALINVMLGINIPVNLPARIINSPFSDLYMGISALLYQDLNAYLISSRDYFDLQFKIYPKYVNVKHHINISFLEHRDLAGVVNFPCFGSAFKDLFFSLVIKNSKDMGAYIYAYDYSNIKDLSCSINTVDYVTQNTIKVNYFYGQRSLPFSNTTLFYEKKEPIYSVNKITLWTNTLTRSINDLNCYITGDYLIKDLGARIRVSNDLHYNASAVKERFVTLKLKNNREVFKRYVELTFNSYVSNYTYFSGNQSAYRNYLDEHWVVRVEGYELLPVGRGFEKAKVRKKYIFNLRDYASIDEAIKDMTNRVTNMRSTDLCAYIDSTYDRVANLSCSLYSKRIYKSNRIINATIIAKDELLTDLPINIVGLSSDGSMDLDISINGTEYTPPTAGTVGFSFTGLGDIVPNPISADFIFDIGDMDGNN